METSNVSDQSLTQFTWYPCPPPLIIPQNCDLTTTVEKDVCEDIWVPRGQITYTSSNVWSSDIPPSVVSIVQRQRIHGVEVRLLSRNHILYGERGLFATTRFSAFDIIGEYTGMVVQTQGGRDYNKKAIFHIIFCKSGKYVAHLDTKLNDIGLGIDATEMGNESRFINSYISIDFEPNVTLRNVYLDALPRVVVVCIKTIEVDDEILMDYGQEYNQSYLSNNDVTQRT